LAWVPFAYLETRENLAFLQKNRAASLPKLCLTPASSPDFRVFTGKSAKIMFDLGKPAHFEFRLLSAWLAI
jgi:hypothetical protein